MLTPHPNPLTKERGLVKMIKALAPFIGMFAVIALFHFTDFVLLKYYPPIANFGFFAVFFSSLFQEKTVIQKIALAAEPDADENVMRYTRNLTYVWAGFTFLNFLISLATVFASEKIWALYNGFISYFLVGTFFIIEYIVRGVKKRCWMANPAELMRKNGKEV